MMQRRVPLVVGRVQRAAVLQQQEHHGGGAGGGGAVDGVLAAAVADARRGLVVDEDARNVEVLFGGDEVEGGLGNRGIRMRRWKKGEERGRGGYLAKVI